MSEVWKADDNDKFDFNVEPLTEDAFELVPSYDGEYLVLRKKERE